MRSTFLSFCVFLLIGCSQSKNEPKQPAQQQQEAANSAMNMLQQLVDEQNYKSLGFQSIDEVRKAQLGQPIEVYSVSLEKLKGYQAGQDPNSLLTPSAETIYPVIVSGNVRTGVTIVRKEQGYESSSFGKADIAKGLAAYRKGAGEFAVRIPAFNLYFLGRHVKKQVLLVPIANSPQLTVQAGEAAPFEEVIDQLRPYVNSY